MHGGGVRACTIELIRQSLRRGGRGAMMNEQIGAGGVQRARHCGPDAPRAARDQRNLPIERGHGDTGRHAKQRYRNVRAA